jgi:hypothetical protein
MSAKCGHCGVTLDTRTADAAEHVATHAPKHSREEQREQRIKRKVKRLERAAKYWQYLG